METPKDPKVAGMPGVQHDDRPDSSHEAEVRKADRGGTSVNKEDREEK